MDFEPQKSDLEIPLISVGDEYGNESILNVSREEIYAEAKKQWLIAGPLLTVNLLLSLVQTISVMMVGHVGELALSGASMATSFASVTGLSLLNGMSCALDAFCGQSYGAKEYHMVGIHTQRAAVVLLMVSIPLACVWATAGDILTILGQDAEISTEAGVYARFMIPTIFAYAVLQCQYRFFLTQNIVMPMLVCTGMAILLHVPICWFLVFQVGLGNKGAALANGMTHLILNILLAIYVWISPSCKRSWTGFSMQAFQGLPKFLILAVPSAIMVCAEVWSFELMVILSGLLPNPTLETSVLSISLNTNMMFYMIPLGFSGAGSVSVSNALGAGQPRIARLAVCVALFMATIEGILVTIIMILGRKVWGYCYSGEERVVNYVSNMMLLIAAMHIPDSIQGVLNGIARGCGWQKIGAIVNLGAFYFIGIPLGVVLAFVYHLGGRGLWAGVMAAVFAQALFLSIVTMFTNWEKEAKKASARVYDSKVPPEPYLT